MQRRALSVTLASIAAILIAPGLCAAQQSFSLHLGGFAPSGEDARAARGGGTSDDVLVSNLEDLFFEIDDFRGGAVGVEWLTAVGDYLEVGLGVGRYSKKVPSVYRDLVDIDGSEIEQDLRLRIVPLTATVRLLPLGRDAPMQPYIGGGVAVLAWRYSEVGEFVDFSDFSIFRGTFVGSGTKAAPLVVGGVRFPIGSLDVGGEIRYQQAEAELPTGEGFAGSIIDLGGVSYLMTLNIRF